MPHSENDARKDDTRRTPRAQYAPSHRPEAVSPRVAAPGWDALVITGLALAFIQILSLAESAALPFRVQDVLRHPILGQMLPAAGYAAMGEIGPRPGEPIGLVLNALGIGLLLLYLVVDLARPQTAAAEHSDDAPHGRPPLHKWRWVILGALILTLVAAPTVKLMLLRDQSGPASYTHDGGVIQTEATIAYLLQGKNPYIEDYVETPMAEWGFDEYRTALYHYPYLPWTFVFSAPFYLLGNALGFYDQRIVYLLLLGLMLACAPLLVSTPRARLALVAALALNPLMGLDVVFGQNDSFVLAWLVFALVAGHRSRHDSRPGLWRTLAWICFGLACASKPTAWFFAPFLGLWLHREHLPTRATLAQWPAVILRTVAAAWPALLTLVVLVGPYLVWDWYALYEDVWRWSSGQGETGYQIWGWGASNFVLALGLVENRFDQWPFLLLQALLAAPLLVWFMHRQLRANTLSHACWHYGLFLLAFFYAGRFLNENYLGYILAFLALGLLTRSTPPAPALPPQASAPPHVGGPMYKESNA